MKTWNIEFYASARGDKPVESFIEKQDAATYAKTLRLLEMLKKYGPDLGMPYSRYLKEEIYELRVRGKNEVRILYIFQVGHSIFLLHAFKKRSQKLPAQELKLAIKRKNDLIK